MGVAWRWKVTGVSILRSALLVETSSKAAEEKTKAERNKIFDFLEAAIRIHVKSNMPSAIGNCVHGPN